MEEPEYLQRTDGEPDRSRGEEERLLAIADRLADSGKGATASRRRCGRPLVVGWFRRGARLGHRGLRRPAGGGDEVRSPIAPRALAAGLTGRAPAERGQ